MVEEGHLAEVEHCVVAGAAAVWAGKRKVGSVGRLGSPRAARGPRGGWGGFGLRSGISARGDSAAASVCLGTRW